MAAAGHARVWLALVHHTSALLPPTRITWSILASSRGSAACSMRGSGIGGEAIAALGGGSRNGHGDRCRQQRLSECYSSSHLVLRLSVKIPNKNLVVSTYQAGGLRPMLFSFCLRSLEDCLEWLYIMRCVENWLTLHHIKLRQGSRRVYDLMVYQTLRQ